MTDALTRALDAAERSYVSASKAVAGRSSRALVSGPTGTVTTASGLANTREQLRHFDNWTFAAIKAVAQRIAAQPVHVGRVSTTPKRSKSLGEFAEPLNSHPMLDALADPNPLSTKWSLLYSTAASVLLSGRAHWWLPSEGKRVEIWYLPPDWCEPLDVFRGEWRVRPKGSAEGFVVPGDELAMMFLPDPSDIFASKSPLQACAPAVAVDEQIQNAQFKAFKNGLFPGMMLRVARMPNMSGSGEGIRPTLTEAQRRDLIAGIKKCYRGVENYGEPLIVDGTIEGVEKLTVAPQEMDFIGSAESVKQRILQSFGVNDIVLGSTQGGNRAQAVTAMEAFADCVVNPLAEQLSQCLTQWVLPRFGSSDGLVAWIEPFAPTDPDLELKQWTTAIQLGCASRNEFRGAVLGLKPDPKSDREPDIFGQLLGNTLPRPTPGDVGTRSAADAPLVSTWHYDRAPAKRNGHARG